jgi:hypothetical protein
VQGEETTTMMMMMMMMMMMVAPALTDDLMDGLAELLKEVTLLQADDVEVAVEGDPLLGTRRG